MQTRGKILRTQGPKKIAVLKRIGLVKCLTKAMKILQWTIWFKDKCLRCRFNKAERLKISFDASPDIEIEKGEVLWKLYVQIVCPFFVFFPIYIKIFYF